MLDLTGLIDNSYCKFHLANRVLTATEARALADALTNNTSLTEIVLNNLQLNDDRMADIVEAIARHPSLKSVVINHMPSGTLNTRASLALADLARSTQTVTRLNLNFSPIVGGGDARTINVINAFATGNSTIKILEMAYMGIDNNAVPSLALAARRLAALDLSGNFIDGAGVGPLADALRNNTKLKALFLYGMPLRAFGIGQLTNGLMNNTVLEFITLGNTTMGEGDIAFVHIKNFLRDQHTLLKLSFNQDNVTAAALEDFPPVMAANGGALQYLDLSHNPFGDGGMVLIASGVGQSGITQLYLTSTVSI